MTDALRRSLVLLIVIALSAGIFAAVSHTRDPERQGILNLLKPAPPSAETDTPGSESEPESFTLAPAAETLPGLTALSQEYANLMDRVRPAVVSINTKTKLDTLRRINLFEAIPDTIDKPGLGSGVIVSKEGHVLTNFHVIDGVDEIQITTNSGRTYECTLIGYRANNDLAVLKITTEEDREFPAIAFGDSDKVRVGEIVFAIGNPFGLGETVTQGIISALPRPLSDSDFKTFQTDTVINPGNSGGPLVGTNGDIVGISTAIFTNSADQSYAGVSLAIPSNDALEAFTSIMEKGKPAKGYLGVRARDLESYDRVRFGAPRDRGVLVAEVTEGSPADKAGLKPGDVVVNFNGRAVRSVEDFITRIGRTTVGKPLPVEVIAGGFENSLEATLVSWEEFFEPAEESGEAIAKISDALGITVQNLSMMHRRRLGLSGSSPGIVLTSVDKGASLAVKLTAGDILYQLNDKPIRTAAQFDTLIDALPPGKEARLFYSRYIGNRLVSGVVRFTPNPK